MVSLWACDFVAVVDVIWIDVFFVRNVIENFDR